MSTKSFCCCIGCGSEADAVIDHELHGQRTVCEEHINGYEVMKRV